MPRRRGSGKDSGTLRGRVRAHDPFELIRWLALSQPDPRKALAELVQNSLDAGARRIRVTRVREHGVACLRILDDGEGVIPELNRPDALRYIATHIGHSRKRSLSPQERMALMTQGQYGIGLLGFWSLGDVLEMRTTLSGQKAHRLVLYRDRPDFLIEPLRGRLALEERWTEIVILGLHREALFVLSARRAADYLAAELRGQLLGREVDLVLEDKISRGRAEKLVPVRPPRFLGEKLEGIGPVPVPGHPSIRCEIYLAGENGSEASPPGLALYCAGTQVAEGFHQLDALGLDHPPWTDPRLIGMIDFAGFCVAPGSRRGIVIDQAAGAFAQAIGTVEPLLLDILQGMERRRVEEIDRTLIRDLQRAFRDFHRRSPRYAMLPVSQPADVGAGPADPAAGSGMESTWPGDAPPAASEPSPVEASGVDVPLRPEEETSLPIPSAPAPSIEYLFPPGPLASARITPPHLRLACGAAREVRAEAVDAADRPVEEPVHFSWSVSGGVGMIQLLTESGRKIRLEASAEPSQGVLTVHAASATGVAEADAEVEVLENLGRGRSTEGIPEPEFTHQPGAAWRSRMEESRWQVNSGHRDFREVKDRPVLKLRYLAMLFAKEVVLRSHQDPRLEKPLEQIVEVMAYADRNLAKRGRRRGGTNSPGPSVPRAEAEQ